MKQNWKKSPQTLIISIVLILLPHTTKSFTYNSYTISTKCGRTTTFTTTGSSLYAIARRTLNGKHTRGRELCLHHKKRNNDALTKVKASDIVADEYFDDTNNNNDSDPGGSTANDTSFLNDDSTTKNISKQQQDLKGIASYSKLIVFISTTIIIWLSEPLLSLVDTTVVGKFASGAAAGGVKGIPLETLQLAALGPATMVCDNAFYLVYFLAIAVTNQLASSSNQPDASSTQVKTTSHALGVASILGSIITLVILFYGDVILKFIIGNGGAMVNGMDMTTHLISSAWDYAKIRGFLAPLTVMGMIAQAVCLATLDTKTPALAVVVASVINVFGDLFLVAKCKMGLRGAAIATAAAGMGSSFILLEQTKKKVRSWRENAIRKSKAATTATTTTTTTKLPSFVSLPDPKSFVSLVKLAGPIFFVLLGKIICYSSMTLKATDFEMMSLATHNIMLRVFFFFCTFGDGFSLAAQSFLPQVLYGRSDEEEETEKEDTKITESNSNHSSDKLKEPSRSDKFRAKILLKRILLLAFGMAALNSSLTKIILQQGGAFFTNDKTILSLLGSTDRVLYMMGAVFLHPLIMAFEGSILATRDLGFLVTSYGITMTILLSTLHFVTSTFTGVWKALFLFQFIRFSIFGSRVFKKTRV